MLNREERRMISAITAAAVMVSVAAVVSIVKNIASSEESETHIYLTQPVVPASQSAPNPTSTPIVVFPETVTPSSVTPTVAHTAVIAHTPSTGYIAAVPLSEALQNVMQRACADYDVPYALAIAVCEAESSFVPDADSGICWGLMQINPINYTGLRSVGIEPTTYEGNIEAGVYMLGQLLDEYDDTHKALMAYNCGETGAARLWQKGYLTSKYSENVVEISEKWQDVLAEHNWR